MLYRGDLPNVAAIVIPPVAVALSVCLLRLLPSDMMFVLVAWILGSFPIGALIGHCVLSEK